MKFGMSFSTLRPIAALPVAALTVAALSGAASAAITGTTGMAFQIGPPPSCVPFALSSTSQVFVWDEQQSRAVFGLPVDLSINPSNSTGPTPGAISGMVDSHFVHFDAIGQANGTVTFNGPILGVAYSDPFLDVSDPVVGAFGTAYPTFTPMRGMFSLPFLNDFVDINGNVLTFKMDTISPVYDFDQIRVYTQVVPAPGTVALLTAGGLLAARRRRA